MNMHICFIEFRHRNISCQEKELIIRVDSFQLSLPAVARLACQAVALAKVGSGIARRAKTEGRRLGG